MGRHTHQHSRKGERGRRKKGALRAGGGKGKWGEKSEGKAKKRQRAA